MIKDALRGRRCPRSEFLARPAPSTTNPEGCEADIATAVSRTDPRKSWDPERCNDRQPSELSTQLGPAYPKVAQLNSQLKEIDRQVQTEINKAVDHLRGEYEAALQRETMLRGSFEKQKQEANKLNESAIEYSLLKRDVESNRTLYEGLLEKLKEAGVTAGLRSNNFRIINAARVPTAPSEPNIPRNLAFALVLGAISGVGLAFLLENMDNTVRTPEQAHDIVTALGAQKVDWAFKTECCGGSQLFIYSK